MAICYQNILVCTIKSIFYPIVSISAYLHNNYWKKDIFSIELIKNFGSFFIIVLQAVNPSSNRIKCKYIYVISVISTPTKHCFELISEQ